MSTPWRRPGVHSRDGLSLYFVVLQCVSSCIFVVIAIEFVDDFVTRGRLFLGLLLVRVFSNI